MPGSPLGNFSKNDFAVGVGADQFCLACGRYACFGIGERANALNLARLYLAASGQAAKALLIESVKIDGDAGASQEH